MNDPIRLSTLVTPYLDISCSRPVYDSHNFQMQFQQQLNAGVLLNKCTEQFCKIHRKALVAESLMASNFIKKMLGHSII